MNAGIIVTRTRPPPISNSAYAWLRLAAVVACRRVGGVGMWSVVVALPAIQADFGVDRAAASLPYTLTMIGFAGGGVLMGRLADRFGIARAADARHACRSAPAMSPSAYRRACWQVALAHGC